MRRLLDNIKFLNRLSYLIGALAICIIIISGIDYLVQHKFKVEHIIIEGNLQSSTAVQFADIAQHRLHGTLFTLDIDGLQQEFRKIQWVKNVTVERKFPNTVKINIEEYQAFARFGDMGLLSVDGVIFNGADDDSNLPIFDADRDQLGELFGDYKILQPFLRQHNINLVSLTLIDGGIIKVGFSNNLSIVICGNNLMAGITLLGQYWERLYALNPNLSYVNLCYRNAMAISQVVHGQQNEWP